MLYYFYTVLWTVATPDLLEILENRQEYLLPDLKQPLEQIMISNIDLDSLPESIQVARTYDCKFLREALYIFGRKHYLELYRLGRLKNLNKEEFTMIKAPQTY